MIWTSVFDSLPGRDVEVLVHFKDGTLCIASLMDTNRGYSPEWWDRESLYSLDEATHWMPLPDPPTPL